MKMQILTSNCQSNFRQHWRLVFYGWHDDYVIAFKQLVIRLPHTTHCVDRFRIEMTTVILLHEHQ